MVEKRYSLVYYADKGGAFIKNNENGTEWYHDSRASLLEIVDELNGLAEENELIKQENKKLKKENELLSDELEQCKAVINKKWSEYLKKKME